MLPDVTAGMEVRPPWPDEMARVREFLPRCAPANPAAWTVAVHGAAARLVAAAARVTAANARRGELLSWRLAAEKYRTAAVLAPLFARALAGAAGVVRTAGFPEEQSVEAAVLRAQGFVPDAVQQVFEMDAAPLFERLAALRERLTARGLIPADARVVRLTDEWLPAARRLYAQHVPGEALEEAGGTLLDAGHAGYLQDHSDILLVGDSLRGLLLSRHVNGVSHVGAILVAPELRGGHAWAQVALFQGSRPPGVEQPVKTVRFTADEHLHPNSVQFGRLWQGRAIGRWVRLRRPVPDTGQNEIGD